MSEPGRELEVFEASEGWDALRGRLTGGRLTPGDMELLDRTVEFAVAAHGDQRRPGGEPYVEHLLEVVTVLAEAVGVTDAEVLAAALLHDVVEDTDRTLDEVRESFGERVAELVDWVTKPEPGEGESAEQVREAYLSRLREAPADAVLVKLADRLSNVQRLDTYPRPEKRGRYYTETVRTIMPLAQSHPWFRAWYASWAVTFGQMLRI